MDFFSSISVYNNVHFISSYEYYYLLSCNCQNFALPSVDEIRAMSPTPCIWDFVDEEELSLPTIDIQDHV